MSGERKQVVVQEAKDIMVLMISRDGEGHVDVKVECKEEVTDASRALRNGKMSGRLSDGAQSGSSVWMTTLSFPMHRRVTYESSKDEHVEQQGRTLRS